MESYEAYLQERYRPATVGRYLRTQQVLQERLGTDGVRWASYRTLTEFIRRVREHGGGPAHVATELAGIKAFYRYLLDAGQRMDDPSRHLAIKDDRKQPVPFEELFSPEELDLLLQRPARYRLLEWRNKLVISCYIDQGLMTGELTRLKVHDLDLERGTMFIEGSPKARSRVLPLEARQVLFAERYLTFDRPALVRSGTQALFVGKGGEPMEGEGCHHVIETGRSMFPGRKLDPRTIRQSVLVNLFKKGWDLRDVQLFAGHCCCTSTERYRPATLDAMADGFAKWHPLC